MMAILLPSHLTAQEPPYVSVPLVNNAGGARLTTAPAHGVEVSAELSKGESLDAPGTRLTFSNMGTDRRMAALEGVPAGPIEGARVLAFDCRVTTRPNSRRDPWGPPPRPIVALFFESDQGAWYRIITRLPDPFALNEVRVPLRGAFRRAQFATDSDDEIRWEQVERVWLGVVDDGPMAGTFEVRRVRFTDEPFRPTKPVRFGEKWELAQDPAIHSTLNLAEHDPPGFALEFEMPGGRHMYAMARTPVAVDELDAYSALRFHTSFATELPEKIDGLLVLLIEADGSQYQAVPAPAVSDESQTITIPFERFARGTWSKDENNQLDLEQVSHVAIGMHGTTTNAAKGLIGITSPQFVP